MQVGFEFQPKAEVKKAEEKVHRYPKYVKPSLDLLEESTDSIEDDAQARAEAAQGIVNKLAVFGIKVEDAGQIVGQPSRGICSKFCRKRQGWISSSSIPPT